MVRNVVSGSYLILSSYPGTFIFCPTQVPFSFVLVRYLYVDFENEELGCVNQKQFSAGGAGALPIYWDKDWVNPYSCKLVNYQTAHSALVEGEYIDCVEENFKVQIR